MGFQSVLVDTAHVVAREPVGEKIAGETQMGTVRKPPFKCRISSPQPDELNTDRIMFPQYIRDLTMLCGMKNVDGDLYTPKADHRIVVESGPYAGEYSVVGKPDPIRKKRTQIGWNIALKEHSGKVA